MVTSHISPAVSLLLGIVAFIFALACATASGETPTTLKVSSMFGDHMVLQRKAHREPHQRRRATCLSVHHRYSRDEVLSTKPVNTT